MKRCGGWIANALLVSAGGLLLWLAVAALATPDVKAPLAPKGTPVVIDERGVSVPIPTGPHRVAVYMGTGAGEYLVDGANPSGLLVQPDSDNALVLAIPYLNRALPGLKRVAKGLRADETATGNVETLLAAHRPILLVTWARLAHWFERAGVPVVGMLPLSTFERHRANTRVFTTVAGRPQRDGPIQTRYEALRDQVARVTATLAGASTPRVATVEFPSAGPLRAFRMDPGEQEVARARQAIALKASAGFVDAERLLAADPDVLVIPWVGGTLSTTPERLMNSPVYGALRAVRCGRVFAAPPGVTGYATNLVEEPIRYRWLAEILHPMLPVQTTLLARAVYTAAFGLTPDQRDLDAMLSLSLNAASRRKGCSSAS